MSKKHIKNSILLSLLVAFSFIPTVAMAESGLKKALFIRPDSKERFWDITEEAMRAACEDLNIKFTVYREDNDPFKTVQKIQQIAAEEDKPDVVFLKPVGFTLPQIFRTLDGAGVDIFTFNVAVPKAILAKTGEPREKYARWIGRMHPDDINAGYRIAEHLYKRAKQKTGRKSDVVNMVAIEGVSMVTPSDTRLVGLRMVVEKYDDFIMLENAEGYWEEEASEKVASIFLEKYSPDLDAIWSVNDISAIGIVNAIKKRGLQPGKDVFVVGIDWLPEIFEYIKRGEIEASLGGHFMGGARAIILAYDYKNGHDFAPTHGVSLLYNMQMIDRHNIEIYGSKIQDMDWADIDFKMLTKTHNPKLEKYEFDVLKLLD